MGKMAFIFPGQGSQAVGMGKDVYDAVPASRAAFDTAERVLGFPLSEMVFDGPDSDLKQTANTQPALLTTSYALYKAFAAKGIQPDYVAGHSLGEYSALVIAGVLRYEDAVAIVRQRGQFMEQAVPSGQGAMAAVLGAERERLGALCDDITADTAPVEMANVNCPGQIVVSGSNAGVQALVERGKEAGAKRVIPLEVSGPFHSTLMKPAAERLGEALRDVTMQDAHIPVVANVSARPEQQGERIRQLLVEQVFSPVLWEDSVRYMIEQGVDTFVEIGAGTVLAGLVKKIDRSVRVISINSLEAIEAYES
ncbi:ACP S-malonyltransferase [Paenibacillus profundus]|uniref:Malonyl CoA-acyl carrier protein transacylase n=1 Tax=Paenibacillus profundus TaxID=1173085 RepID=A0ABS8YD64_9BACL|nr:MULTISPECIES: ACP S-malonyltransferase [Paenibacillus]MCE5168007.1 ACP S-malonyltransferase [Paenibacillus profundus]